jgi:hypothetical protein
MRNDYLLKVSATTVVSTKVESATTKVLSVVDTVASVVGVVVQAVIASTNTATIAKIDFFMFCFVLDF